jgi:predicted nuclease with TOPRIM domain
MAKSTLLRALQTERSNVHELETAVASLQQNNSAIAEMVDSRDMIIDELNNRIAVFEEDKVVLKAALRQLQKEMKEEAPKTQKLLEDLADAKKGKFEPVLASFMY